MSTPPRRPALDLGRDDPGPLAPLRWVKSFASERVAPVTLTVDRAKATEAITAAEGDRRTKPVEPKMNVTADKIDMTPGKAGKALDIDDIIDNAPAGITKSAATSRSRPSSTRLRRASPTPTWRPSSPRPTTSRRTRSR